MAQWNPLHDLVSLQDRMNRLFEDATQRRTSEGEKSDEVEGADWYPAADVYENDNEYTVAVDVPGIDRTSLEIDIDDDRLTIKASAGQETTLHRGNAPGAGSYGRLAYRLRSIKALSRLTIKTACFKYTFRNARSERHGELRLRFHSGGSG